MPALASGKPPFRADHVGSLLRPAALLQAFKQHQNGSIGDDAFRELQDRSKPRSATQVRPGPPKAT